MAKKNDILKESCRNYIASVLLVVKNVSYFNLAVCSPATVIIIYV